MQHNYFEVDTYPQMIAFVPRWKSAPSGFTELSITSMAGFPDAVDVFRDATGLF